MSPTPVSMSDPTSPAGYSWEATSEQVAARYGVPVEEIVRFDLNTSPEPPGLAARILAAGRFETSLSEYPPSDYRRLTEAAAGRTACPPTRSWSVPGRTRSSTSRPRRSCRPAGRPSSRPRRTRCTAS